VSGLAERGLVLREIDADDARGVRLALGKAGRRVYDGLIRAAAQRDAAFRDCLSGKESEVFERALNKLAGEARRFIQSEKVAK
jgi:DNA-binding MarR family transcriptional regulator